MGEVVDMRSMHRDDSSGLGDVEVSVSWSDVYLNSDDPPLGHLVLKNADVERLVRVFNRLRRHRATGIWEAERLVATCSAAVR